MIKIPESIEKKHIIDAIKEIKLKEVPINRKSKSHFLCHKKKLYPPKYVLSIANKFVSGKELDPNGFHTYDAKHFLEKRGLEVIVKK